MNNQPQPSRNRGWLLGALLVAATFLAYLPAWNGKPIWDDNAHITGPGLRSLQGLERIWIEPGATQQYYPLVHSFFWLEHRLWGETPLGYHLVNILFHALSALLLLKILRRLEVPGAWLAAALFALHPVEVESVAWISELKNTMSAALCFGSVLAYLEFDRSRRGRFYAIAIGLFLLGLAAKSVIATLPAALLVVFWWKRGKLSWKRDALPLVPFFAVGIVAGLFTSWMERHFIGAEGSAYNFTITERFLIAGRAVWFYLGKLFWPADLIFSYPRWNISQAVWWQYLFPAAAALLLGALWILRRRWRGPLAAMLFFVGTLFPALGFFNVFPFRFSFVADHFQYIAGIGPLVLASAGIHAIFKRFGGRRLVWETAFCTALLATLCTLTWSQCRMYSDVEMLWRTTIYRNPGSWMAHLNLGAAILPKGRVNEAIIQFRTALAIWPDYAEAHNDLGAALLQKGQADAAIIQCQMALAIRPNYAEAHNNLGDALFQKGQTEEAITQFQEALEIQPGFAESHNSLGAALLQKGQRDEAIVQFQKAVAVRPGYAEAHYNLGVALLQGGQPDEAIIQFQKTVAIRPDFAEADYKLGVALLKKGRTEEAVSQFQKALAIRPDYADAHYDLGNALFLEGRTEEAIVQLQKALAIQPDYVEAHNNLGAALLQKGRVDEAIVQFQKAVAIKPDYAEAHNNLGYSLVQKGRVAEAIVHLQKTLELQPGSVEAQNDLAGVAWRMATSPEPSVRNGAKAVELARQTDQLTGGSNPTMAEALAAAYAEAGRFPEAIETAQRAMKLAAGQNNAAMVASLQAQLKCYQAGSPFRDNSLTNNVSTGSNQP